jgi:hypothetical protein
MIQERTETFFSTFVYLFERKGMNQNKFVEYINAQPLPIHEHPPYRNIAPLNKSTLSRILSGNLPDAETLYRISRYGFGLSLEACGRLEDERYETFLMMQEEKRTTQQMAIVRKEPEVHKIVEEEGDKLPKIPAWILFE